MGRVEIPDKAKERNIQGGASQVSDNLSVPPGVLYMSVCLNPNCNQV